MAARPNSLARTQKQVQSSTADLLGPGSHSLILLVPQSLVFWGRAKGLVRASSHLKRLSSDPCPLAKPLEVYGVCSVLVQLWGRHHPTFGRHHEFRSCLGPRSCFWETVGLGQLGDGPLLASSFIALSSLPSLCPSLYLNSNLSLLAPHV